MAASSPTPAGTFDVTAFLSGPGSHAHLCDTLERVTPGWLATRFAETDVIAALPRFHDEANGLREIWRAALPPLSNMDDAAEKELSRRCAASARLGISRTDFVTYQFEPAALLSDARLKRLGIDVSYFRGGRGREAIDYADDLHHRTVGAAGWLICRKEFRDQRDALVSEWQALPEQQRPPLPLSRLPKLEVSPADTSRQHPSRLTDFWRGFNAFCDTWRLLGMVTWDLPNADGPKWSEDYPGKPAGLEGAESLDTPWHFPVEGKDDLGRMLTERHQQRAADHGFVDQSRWETYAHFLKIDFWERVIRSRYAECERPKAEVSRILAVLAELTGCDNERVKKLRHTLHAFQRGDRTSLPGVR